jgi:nucleoside-diphosphate-sugar epimerase
MLLRTTRVLLTGASGFIGTNLVDLLESLGATVHNLDVQKPLNPAKAGTWIPGDVMDSASLTREISSFDPHIVLHLAARTDTQDRELSRYKVNFEGLSNVVNSLAVARSARRFVFFSSQFVLGPGRDFVSDTVYHPHTAYGESKAIAEQQLRLRPPPGVTWTIVRPTNVWGPWHERYRQEFWRVVGRGVYFHPSYPDPVRSYGYVGSVCLQVAEILLADQERIDRTTLYLGDRPIPQSQWVDAFSLALRGRRAHRVPRAAISAAAWAGEVAQRAHLPAPLTRSRYRSMMRSYPTPMSRTERRLGTLPVVDLDTGVRESVAWIRSGEPPNMESWLDAWPRYQAFGPADGVE